MKTEKLRRFIPRPLRGKLRVRARLSPVLRLSSAYRTWEKRNAELEFWVTVFDARFRESRFWMEDVEELLREYGEWPEGQAANDLDYARLRWLEGRALFLRVIKETGINDRTFFTGKRVIDIGPGPMGLLETCDARVKIAIEPLAVEFHQNNLLIPCNDTIYLPFPAESIPLLDGSADIVIARNSLDHVENPREVFREIHRLLAPGGIFLLNVDLDHEPTIWEPHTFSLNLVHQYLYGLETVREITNPAGQRRDFPVLIGVYRKPNSTQGQR